jgi:hypothetical protein
MTPAQMETAARQRYNAVGDTNWSTSELMTLIYGACLELVRECKLVIQKKYTATTTAAVGEYSFPTNAVSLKRVTFDGKKLNEITMREDDSLTLQNQLTTDTGAPEYYYVWSDVIYLRPIPTSVGTLTIFAEANPQEVTSTSSLEVPANIHMGIVDYMAAHMAAKDLNWTFYDKFIDAWSRHKLEFRAFLRKNKRADGFVVVQSEELLPHGSLGSQ